MDCRMFLHGLYPPIDPALHSHWKTDIAMLQQDVARKGFWNGFMILVVIWRGNILESNCLGL